MKIDEQLLTSLRQYSTEALVDEMTTLGIRISGWDQKFQLMPEAKPIEGKDRADFINAAIRIAAISTILQERAPRS